MEGPPAHHKISDLGRLNLGGEAVEYDARGRTGGEQLQWSCWQAASQ